jgi:imidazolonepropionase-like amidohydrolase
MKNALSRLNRIAPLATIAATIAACFATTNALAQNDPDTWVLRGAKIYTEPTREPIQNGVVVIRGGKIAAVGAKGAVTVPANAKETACSGGVITAGFQNSHVHFIGESWNAAARQPADELSNKVAAMLTRYGYSTVFDIASDRDNTLALRARITKGEVKGPRILTTGLPIFPANGIPIYLHHFPGDFIARLPQPASVEAGVKVVRENLDAGADATKLFLVTPQAGPSKRIPADIALAAANETHKRGKLVFAHPTDIAGVEAALAAGVDVLAHTTHGVTEPWPAALLKKTIGQGVSLIPTLKLMGYELKKENVPPDIAARLIAASVSHTKDYANAGGQILFGTDVGYMTDFDPTEEYVLLGKAGMSYLQILASLTTTPATRWKESNRRGRVAPEMDADLVVLYGDPMGDVANFSKVRCTIRAGKVIYPLKPLTSEYFDQR